IKWRVAIDCRDWKAMTKCSRRCVLQIPHEALHPSFRDEHLWRAKPILRHWVILRVNCGRLVVTRKTTNDLIVAVDDLERDRSRSVVLEIVVDDCTIRWILSGRFFGWQRRVGIYVALDAIRNLRRE